MKNLGSKIERNPIVHAIGRATGCVDPKTNRLRTDSPCAKMRNNLNAGMSLPDAIYQRWFAAKERGEKMKYQAVVVIESDKLTEAAQKAESIGEVLSIQAKPESQVHQKVRLPITGIPQRTS